MTGGTSPLAAIRGKCVDCCGGQLAEVRLCPVTRCTLHPFRMGRRPKKAGQELSPEAKAALLSRLGGDRALLPDNQGQKAASEGDLPCVRVGAASGIEQ
jgi:hypothetical protein